MKSIEDVIAEKLCAMINYALSKVIKPDIKINKVTELDEKTIKRLKQKYGIEGIILDVDDTLRKNMNQIPEVNKNWIQSLDGLLKVIILSNGKDRKIEEFFREKGIDYIAFAHKPLKKNFLKACKQIELEPSKVLVVGDSIIDDVYGGKINHMKTALVKDVDEER